MFKELRSCEQYILYTTEYEGLNHYIDIEYNEKLCSKIIDSNEDKKKEKD